MTYVVFDTTDSIEYTGEWITLAPENINEVIEKFHWAQLKRYAMNNWIFFGVTVDDFVFRFVFLPALSVLL